VVVAMQDPNPLVSGRGIECLRAAGVVVEVGLMEAEARELNVGFISRMTRGRPWVRMKCAASLDGRTALANGASKWITSPAARMDVQKLRARACAMLTGAGTVLADDPQMNVREIDTPRQPRRVVVDTYLSVPATARILQGGDAVVVTASEDKDAIEAMRAAGVEVVEMGGGSGHVDLPRLVQWLGEREINELMIEAGATLSGAFLQMGLVDELVLYLAPSILGGGARGLFSLPELQSMEEKIKLNIRDVRMVGSDLRIVARMGQ
jgi:diaminohydroxyphosphoribosylaminopyrimidine deaminase/5-amino-6-(5-phosphoribosylamino)uracil reductase